MPVVIGVVAAFAAGAAGVAAVATATTIVGTLAAYSAIAGAVLTGVGALSGSKDLMKIGAVLSIGGGLASMAASGAAGGGAAAGEIATAGTEELAIGAAGTGTEAAAGAAATSPVYAGAADAAVPLVEGASAAPIGTLPTAAPNSLAGAYETAATTTGGELGANALGSGSAGTVEGFGDYGSSLGSGAAGTSGTMSPSISAGLKAVTEGGQSFNGGDLAAWWQKAQDMGGSVAKFTRDNPALMKVGGEMLASMYGPEAEMFDYKKSLMDRARANMNSPIKLTYQRPGG